MKYLHGGTRYRCYLQRFKMYLVIPWNMQHKGNVSTSLSDIVYLLTWTLLVLVEVICFSIIECFFSLPLHACWASLAVNTQQPLSSSVVAAAMEILSVIGFNEDAIIDETGRTEAYLVLKRNDPGLLWLAKSSLEASIA